MLFFGIAIPKKETKASSSTTTSAEKELVVVVEKAIDEETDLKEMNSEKEKEKGDMRVEVEVEAKAKAKEEEVGHGFFSTVFGKHDQHICKFCSGLQFESKHT